MPLRRAQLDLINGRDERFKNPYYWSAFAALGGYSEFSFNQKIKKENKMTQQKNATARNSLPKPM
jgi:hypothetical protein